MTEQQAVSNKIPVDCLIDYLETFLFMYGRFSLGKTFFPCDFVLGNNKTKLFWRIEGQANSLIVLVYAFLS